MKKNKILSLAVATVTLLSIAAGGTYAWFTTRSESQSINVSTGVIDACVSAFSEAKENLLPGEVHKLDLHPTAILNSGTRDMVCEFTIGDVSKATLKKGQVPTPELQSDYIQDSSDSTIWYLTKDRLMQVAQFEMINTVPVFEWKLIGDKYYALIKAKENYFVGNGQVTMKSEMGGSVKQADGTFSPERPFEQGMSLAVANSILGVQNTKEACFDVFGEDIANQFPDSWFD